MVPPPEGKRRGLRRLVGRRRREGPAEEAAEAEIDDERVTAEVDAVAEAKPDEVSDAPEPTPEQVAAAQLEARFDAARDRLRSTITPPDPDDG